MLTWFKVRSAVEFERRRKLADCEELYDEVLKTPRRRLIHGRGLYLRHFTCPHETSKRCLI